MFILYAIPIGIVAGYLLGGRLDRLGDIRFRWGWLAIGGLIAQVVLFSPPAADIETTYVALGDAGQRAVLAGGGNLSHHHGVGLNRARFMSDALGPAFDVLAAVKAALDPNGILNPGKLGLPTAFGPPPWPQP